MLSDPPRLGTHWHWNSGGELRVKLLTPPGLAIASTRLPGSFKFLAAATKAVAAAAAVCASSESA